MKWYKNNKHRLQLTLILITLIIVSPALSFAQDAGDLPCDGNDPYSNYCPLDTWNVLLVIAGVALGGYKIYQLNKATRLPY